MDSRTNTFLATIGLWIAVVVALGYWRMFYAWRWGAAYVFFFRYLPVLVLILVLVLVLEAFYFGRKLRNGD
jgi:ABC-type amino acid transport system permease subunit